LTLFIDKFILSHIFLWKQNISPVPTVLRRPQTLLFHNQGTVSHISLWNPSISHNEPGQAPETSPYRT